MTDIDADKELSGSFFVRHSNSSELSAKFGVNQSGSDLKSGFRVTKTYDLRGTMGVAFYWEGTGDNPEVLVGFILETPTGFWYSTFYDGPSRLRHVLLPWGSFIWVSAEQRYLEPHRHGFNEPNKSQIDGFYWTVHTAGRRRVDYIYAPIGGVLPAKFTIRRSTSVALSAGFDIRRSASITLRGKINICHIRDLVAQFEVTHSKSLPAEFDIRRDASQDLPAEFVSQQAGSQDLAAKFTVNP